VRLIPLFFFVREGWEKVGKRSGKGLERAWDMAQIATGLTSGIIIGNSLEYCLNNFGICPD